MATNIGTHPRGHALAHITLVSFDLSRLRAIRARRTLAYSALGLALVFSGAIVAAVVGYLGAPAWLAIIFGVVAAYAVFVTAGAVPERVGPSFYGDAEWR